MKSLDLNNVFAKWNSYSQFLFTLIDFYGNVLAKFLKIYFLYLFVQI